MGRIERSDFDPGAVRVLLNATSLLSPFTGIGQYVRSLAAALKATRLVDLTFFYGLGFSRDLRDAPVPGIEGSKRIAKAFLPRPYETKRLLQAACFRAGGRRAGADLYHEPNFLPFKYPGPTVITAHDISWVRYPETHPGERVRMLLRHFGPALERSGHILTPSEFVRSEVISVYAVAPERVTAVKLAARQAFVPIEEATAADTLRRHGVGWRGFFLCVGTLEPRKNLELVLQAYANLPDGIRKRFPLVIVGMKGWLTSRLDKLVASLAREGQVRPVGYVDDAELAHLYASARMLIYPSLYEGFGLPPLEAMASGTPVIVSNVSSLPEVVGDAGIQVDPHDVDALRSAVNRLAEDDALWDALRSAGLARAAQFSWRRCAEQTLAVYRKVLGQPVT